MSSISSMFELSTASTTVPSTTSPLLVVLGATLDIPKSPKSTGLFSFSNFSASSKVNSSSVGAVGVWFNISVICSFKPTPSSVDPWLVITSLAAARISSSLPSFILSKASIVDNCVGLAVEKSSATLKPVSFSFPRPEVKNWAIPLKGAFKGTLYTGFI